MAVARKGVASCQLMNKIYAIGGWNLQNPLRSAEIYDPLIDAWKSLPPMSERRSAATGVAFNNKIYVIGGVNENNQIHDSVEIFNPATNEWSFGSSLTVPRCGAAAVVYNDKIFVIGGNDGTRRLKTVEVYDPLVSPNWQLHAKKLNVARSSFAATVTEDKILVIGGYVNTEKTENCEIFDEQGWVETKPLISARGWHTAVNLDHYSLNFKDFL